MQQKSLEVEEKLIGINERWDKLKSRLDEEPMKFLKTLKILKNQILEVSKSKDDIIQTVKNDFKRINSTYHAVLEKQVTSLRCFATYKMKLKNLKFSVGL